MDGLNKPTMADIKCLIHNVQQSIAVLHRNVQEGFYPYQYTIIYLKKVGIYIPSLYTIIVNSMDTLLHLM